MSSNARLGELLVGAYHKIETQCEVVSYNQRSSIQGAQLEVDVIGIHTDTDTHKQTVYVAEVLTHLDSQPYSGTPDSDRWSAYGGNAYQNTLEKLWEKFTKAHSHVTETFPNADDYRFQFWSPTLPEGSLLDGIDHLAADFEEETGYKLSPIINQDYSVRVDALRSRASEETKRYSAPAFRFLQILEHMRR